MRYRSSAVLFLLFLTGLGVLWWADRTRLPDREARRALLNRVLPELVDVPVGEVRRVEVLPGPGAAAGRAAVAVERREGGGWQLTRPVDAAADASLVETLVANLKDLRAAPDAGTIEADPAAYGLARPVATVKVYGGPPGPAAGEEPLATLDVGATSGTRLYVRPGGATGIEVVDARRLEALDAPPARWRDTTLFHVPSFRVASVTVEEPGAGRTIELTRDERHWRLVRPIQVPADDDRAEGLVAELSALHVAGDADGFVKDDVPPTGRAAFGLDRPSMTLTLTPVADHGKPQTLLLGAPVPDQPDQVYAVRADQDDVVRLDVKRLREAIPGVNGLRSQTVLAFSPPRVNRLRIETRAALFDLARTAKGWELLSPERRPADPATVQSLLKALADLKASEFLDPARFPFADLDPPAVRIRGWQAEPGAGAGAGAGADAQASADAPPRSAPRFDLSLGRHDTLKRSIFGRVAGDTTVLALPDALLSDLPRNEFAFRDRKVLDLKITDFARLTIARGDAKPVTVEASGNEGPANRWRMIEPVRAPVDMENLTTLLMTLATLRAERWEGRPDGDAYGLDHPRLTLTWTLRPAVEGSEAARPATLRVGKDVPRSTSAYARIEGDDRVFTLTPAQLVALEGELHDRSVLRFNAATAERISLTWPTTAVSLNRQKAVGSAAAEWVPAVPFAAPGVDVSQVNALVGAMADLTTPRFAQYAGPIPEAAGLAHPRLTVRLKLSGVAAPLTLRLGAALTPETFTATTSPYASGPVFVVTVPPAWKGLLHPPRRPDDLPEDVFTPSPAAP